MVEHAAQALGDRATVLCQDLVELSLPEPVDVVFSNATFHWIQDHDELFAAIHRTLKPGGRLHGPVRRAREHRRVPGDRRRGRPRAAVRALLRDWQRPWNYATDIDTAEAPARGRVRRGQLLARAAARDTGGSARSSSRRSVWCAISTRSRRSCASPSSTRCWPLRHAAGARLRAPQHDRPQAVASRACPIPSTSPSQTKPTR